MARELQEAGWIDPMHRGWRFCSDAEVEYAYEALEDETLDALAFRYPEVSMLAGHLLRDLEPERRQGIGALLALAFVHGWIARERGEAL